MSMASLGVAMSGLMSAQKGIQVTSHNISNVNTSGYTRQQLLQHDSGYITIGNVGGYSLQRGLGVSDTEIRQIRDSFIDLRYRTQNSVLSFYQVQATVTSSIESILDEPYGETFSTTLENMWSQAQKLSINTAGVEERMTFIQTAQVLLERMTNLQSSLQSYQDNLNAQVIAQVNRINDLAEGIQYYNELIAKSEIGSDLANDYRDQRNLLLDELSSYIDIDYTEQANGSIVVKTNGRALVDEGFVYKLELAQTEAMSPYVKPVWADTGADLFTFTIDDFNAQPLNSLNGNDTGSLKALLLSRGPSSADADTTWDDIAINNNYSVDVSGNAYVIPEIQKKLDTLMCQIVEMMNECMNGEGIGEHEGLVGVPMFTPINGPYAQPTVADFTDADGNIDVDGYNAAMLQYHEDIKPFLYQDNIEVNPLLLEDGGYNRLGTVTITGDVSDNQKVMDLLDSWSSQMMWYTEYEEGDQENIANGNIDLGNLVETVDGYDVYDSGYGVDAAGNIYKLALQFDEGGNVVYDATGERVYEWEPVYEMIEITGGSTPTSKYASIHDFYAELVSEIGLEGSDNTTRATIMAEVVSSIENERFSLSAVSLDEELASLMKYQYSYSAAARMITTLDGMLDVVINQLKR